ncbi:TPA: ABC transporter ATP-binding protein [Legionella pneumophila]|uniref:ABC transporter ATP-binding protein n=1 Tax=Legionella pneumophila TaxID=446 RepID=UPI0009B56B0A|nr:ABC transporter ATP-binding protein [Legionella pneumophila]HAT1881541.1 ABC transporter ATP-binding protein [Legionella pneumophila]HAT2113449.1 ABC transporter ATP-binding protein [Legionella pneumophila]HAT6935363.1 ATP-binding cassette domain-containing protein [Legionella pneumophila]HAT8721166.1 ATP-binding cassette domain-containing protein [Legionella pneumophila]HAU1192885.1 ABC transporter ATP-binding protein [Legionella pneumophila]
MSKKVNRPQNFRSFFFEMATPYRWWFFAMLLVGIYSAIHNVLQPYVLKILLDAVAHAEKKQFLDVSLKPALLLIILGFVITFIWRLYNYIVLRSLPKIKADIIAATTAYLRDQSYVFFQDHLSGSISAKISDLASNIQNIVNTWFNISRQGLTIILSIAMVGLVSPYFSLIFFVISIAFIATAYYCSHSIKPYAKSYAEARAKNIGNIVDCFSNVLNMLLFARESYEARYLEKTTASSVERDQSMQFKNMLNASLLGGFAWILQGASILLLLFLGNRGTISVGDFVFIFILAITVIDQIWFLTESLLVVGEQAGQCQQAIDTIFTEHYQKPNPEAPSLNITHGEIIIEHVRFGYKSDDIIIKDLSIHIPGGSKVGLVGYSGGGKSTLVQLIMRLYDVQNGKILIDKQDISTINKQSLRENIAFIPQHPSLFHRTVYENILYGKIGASYEEVVNASKKAHAHEFIVNLPQGYDTHVGERGVKLSGGQCQRIAIARAILKDAPILILDEATSSLDSLTEKLIQESLHIAMSNRTVIVIAHRLSTILSMDNILVMDKGKIIEMGNHKQLIDAGGFYNTLWNAQSGHSFI